MNRRGFFTALAGAIASATLPSGFRMGVDRAAGHDYSPGTIIIPQKGLYFVSGPMKYHKTPDLRFLVTGPRNGMGSGVIKEMARA